MRSDFTPVSRRSDIVLVVSTAVVFLAVSFFANLERALLFAVVSGVFVSIVQTRRRRRGDSGFWMLITALAIIHVVALSIIRLPELRFGLVVLPFALADGIVIWGLISWFERHFPDGANADTDK
jgi:hypothetical protein